MLNPDLLHAISIVAALALGSGANPIEVYAALGAELPNPNEGTSWNHDGSSKPDARGLHQSKRLLEFADQLRAAGYGELCDYSGTEPFTPEDKRKIFPFLGSEVGKAQLEKGSDRYLDVVTDVAWADKQTLSVVMAGRCFVGETTENENGQLQRKPKKGPDSTRFYATWPDAEAFPRNVTSMGQIEAIVTHRIANWIAENQRGDISGIDFSPAQPPKPKITA